LDPERIDGSKALNIAAINREHRNEKITIPKASRTVNTRLIGLQINFIHNAVNYHFIYQW